MKKLLLFLSLILVISIGCESLPEIQEPPLNENISAEAARYLIITQQIQQIQVISSLLQSNYKYRKLSELNKFVENQHVFFNYSKEMKKNIKSGTVEEGIDEEGFYYFSIDFGTVGCELFGLLIKGTYINKYKYERTEENLIISEDYKDFSIQENAESEPFKINGSYYWIFEELNQSEYIGISGEELEFEYLNEHYQINAFYTDIQTAYTYTALQGESKIENITKNYSFNTKIIKPITFNYYCDINTYNPSKGRESIELKEFNYSYEFMMDYGEGHCDNIISIIEEGLSYVINLDEYYDWSIDFNDHEEFYARFYIYFPDESNPLAVQFYNTSYFEDNEVSFEWNFGDGTTSAETNPLHIYNEQNTFTVSLKMRSANNESIYKQKIDLSKKKQKTVNFY